MGQSISKSSTCLQTSSLSFEVENLETITSEFKRLTTELNNLEDYTVSHQPAITVSFRALLSMFDGKGTSNLTNKNTTKCRSVMHQVRKWQTMRVLSTQSMKKGLSLVLFRCTFFFELLNYFFTLPTNR